MFQNVEAGSRMRRIAVTSSVTAPYGLLSCRREPGCRPNRVAVCAVTATPSAWPPAPLPVSRPAVTRACAVNGSR